MRLIRVLLFVYASFPSAIQMPCVHAIHPQAFSRQTTILNKPSPQERSLPPHSNRLSSRGSLTDICASVDLGLLAELEPLLGFKLPERVSMASHYCLCLKDLDFYLDTNTDLASLVTLFGRDTFLTYLQVLIKTSSTKQECVQVPHVYNTCNDPDLNTMSVTSITQVDNSCVCTASLSSGDRACRGFPDDCASVGPNTSESDEFHAAIVNEASCRAHKTACHTLGHENTSTYGWSDVKTTAESCGGCFHPLCTIQPSQPMGVDCRRIAHAEKVNCADDVCVIQSCTPGWVPSAGGETCIQQSNTTTLRMRRVTVKGRAINTNQVTLDIHVVIDLAQLFKSLHDLRLHSDYLRNSSTTESSVTLVAVNEISQATEQIVMSRTLGSFLVHTRKLSILARRIDDALSSCKVLRSHMFDGIRADVKTFVVLTTDILDWYRATSWGHGTPNTISSEAPIAIQLDRLFTDLSLSDLKTVVKTKELGSWLTGSVNGLLDDLTTGPNDELREQIGGDSGLNALLTELERLVGFVLQLEDPGSLLSLKADDSVDLGALAPVSLATLGIMTSTRISGLSSGIDLLVLASTDARVALSSCGGCDTVVDNLYLITKAAIATKASCEEFSPDEEITLPFSIPTSGSVSPPDPASMVHSSTTDTIRRSKGAPVVIVLDGLLYSVGFGGTTANISIGGLDGRLSGMLNGVLALLNTGGKRLDRRGGFETSSAIFVDPELANAFRTAVEGVIDLESKSAGPGPLTTLLAGLMPPVLSSLQAVLGSPTVTELISAVDGLLGVAKTMDKALTGCNCTSGPVLESSRRFVAAAGGMQNWINEHPDIARTGGTE